MALPKLNIISTARVVQEEFRGYDHNERISDAAFFHMENLTGEEYPLLSTRKPRGYGAALNAPAGLTAKDALAVVDGRKIIYNGYEIDMELSGGEKQLISMGAYLLIWPDKKWLNTQNLSEYGSMENRVETAAEVTATLSKQNGTALGEYTVSASTPENPKDGDLWMDISGQTPALKQYSESSATWLSVASVYIKLSCVNIGTGFEKGDGVTITGLTGDLAHLNGSHVLQTVENDSIVIAGIMQSSSYTENNVVTIERTVPDMDYVTECGNRIWGCKYGVVNGKPVNEIYASKLGDFKNWNCFEGLSTDSYAASRGSDGVFTGAVTHQGHPLFFKEECIEKVYPDAAGAHQIVTTEARGVQRGCWRSLVIVDETLYYKSRADVCAYAGSLPSSVSEALGEVRYSDARAGAEDGMYYISMKDETGAWHLFVYDTATGMWHREDNTKAMMFAACEGRLWWIDEEKKRLVCRDAAGLEEEGKFAWKAETGVLGLDLPENKYMSNLLIRAELEEESAVRIEVRYENGEWEKKLEYDRPGLRSFNIPVLPSRSDHLRMRISGEGQCKIYSISKQIRRGSEKMW